MNIYALVQNHKTLKTLPIIFMQSKDPGSIDFCLNNYYSYYRSTRRASQGLDMPALI